ncbi:MAG: late competence development ComFB family protein [Spirochaetales bacterium]
MRVHNLVKDLVVQKVDEMFSDPAELKAAHLDSDDQGSKFDVICYVLNRMPPHYVVSGRGIAHAESGDFQAKVQSLADMTRITREGMASIAKHKRERTGSYEVGTDGPYFNFPSVIGRLFNGVNFEPVHDIDLGLYHNGTLVKVIDPNWQNPYRLVLNTAGTYLFWPHPVQAPALGSEQAFEFELRTDDPRFEPLHYFFTLNVSSSQEFIDFVNTTASTRLKDLYLFPRE